MWCENYDLESIVTPVDPIEFGNLLRESNYDVDKTNFIVDGFSHGFPLMFHGNQQVKTDAENLKLRVHSQTELWNKLMKEVQLKRVAGPFKEIPYEHYIQSPIGLVPKDSGTKTRLIFHLSYLKAQVMVSQLMQGYRRKNVPCSILSLRML